jgi:hypothetical protein
MVDQLSNIHSRGVLPFPETQNKGLKLRNNHPKLPEICEIVNEEGIKEINQ